MKKILSIFMCAVMILGFELSAGAADQEPKSASTMVFAMDTIMDLKCYGERCEEAITAAKQEILRIDEMLSVGNESSEISVINSTGSGVLSEDSCSILSTALSLWNSTEGAFDITVFPLMEEWGFTSSSFRVPGPEEISETLKSVGSEKLSFDSEMRELQLGKAKGIDFGGIAKGYTSGRLMEIFEEYGIEAGIVSLGGNVQCFRTKPDGKLWRCAIRDPLTPDASGFLGILSVADCAVITSGAYERFFVDEETGKTYHHILDPKTGYPSDSGLISVTIISPDGTLADGLSTALYIMGEQKAEEYWRKYGENFNMILMTSDGTVFATEPIAEQLETDYPLHVITR